MNAETYCRAQAAPPGSTLYYCLLYQPRQHRRGLRTLFAFEDALWQIIATNTDPGLARMRLQWWLSEIEKVFCHASQHPIGMELQAILQQAEIDKARLIDSINAIERHIHHSAIEDYPAWLSSLGRYKGGIWRNAAMLCACADEASLVVAEKAGRVLAVLDVLQHLPRYLQRGLCPLPRKAMQQHGITAEMLQQDSRQQAVRALFADLITAIVNSLRALQAEVPACDRQKLLFCRVALGLAHKLCAEIRRDKYRLLEKRIMLTPLRKLMLAWRTK